MTPRAGDGDLPGAGLRDLDAGAERKATAASVGTVTVIAAAFGALDDAVVVGERPAIAGAGLIDRARRHGISAATMSAMSFGENERSSMPVGSAISAGVTCRGSSRAAEV